MDNQEFKVSFQRLKNRKGWDQKFDEGFVMVLWSILQGFPVRAFNLAVNDLLGQHNCPTVRDIVDLTRKHRGDLAISSLLQFDKCSSCNGYGLVRVERNNASKGLYFAACMKCPNGEKQQQIAEKTFRQMPSGESYKMPTAQDAIAWGHKVF